MKSVKRVYFSEETKERMGEAKEIMEMTKERMEMTKERMQKSIEIIKEHEYKEVSYKLPENSKKGKGKLTKKQANEIIQK